MSACIGQNVSVDDPTLHAVAVTIHIVPDTANAATEIQQLGWSGGVPGATVVLRSTDSASVVLDSGQTDANGNLNVGIVPHGNYRVTIRRLLGAADRTLLQPTSSLEAFVLDGDVPLGNASTVTVAALASTRGSLLTSEWFFWPGYYGQYSYETGGYWKLYNNADTTVYLDGLLLGEGFLQTIETQLQTCAVAAQQFLPADGAWAAQLNQFPGTGRQFPLPSGQSVLIATDAIDHRPLFQNALDLRDAAFEFIGPADVDNPSVPNMVWLGPQRSREGHGESFFSLGGVPLIALPLDTGSLARKVDQGGNAYFKLPASDILDVAALRYFNSYGHVECPALVNPSLNRDVLDAGYGSDPFIVSEHRRILYTRSDGRQILSNTRSSRTDFVDGQRTPTAIP